MKKLALLLVVALVLSFAGVNAAFAGGGGGLCRYAGTEAYYEDWSLHQDGAGGFHTVEIHPGFFQEVQGVYSWTYDENGTGYWLFTWELYMACNVPGSTYSESGSTYSSSSSSTSIVDTRTVISVPGTFIASRTVDVNREQFNYNNSSFYQQWVNRVH
jgi:hypothetical protein